MFKEKEKNANYDNYEQLRFKHLERKRTKRMKKNIQSNEKSAQIDANRLFFCLKNCTKTSSHVNLHRRHMRRGGTGRHLRWAEETRRHGSWYSVLCPMRSCTVRRPATTSHGSGPRSAPSARQSQSRWDRSHGAPGRARLRRDGATSVFGETWSCDVFCCVLSNKKKLWIFANKKTFPPKFEDFEVFPTIFLEHFKHP